METIYKSNYTDKKITIAQFLAEKVCERLAKKDKVDLPQQFWRLTKWKRPFLYQVQVANGLLKIYRPEAIIAALKKNPKIYSLNAPFLDQLIMVEQEQLERREAVKPEPEPVQPEQPREPVPISRPAFIEKKSPLAKLREHDRK